MLLKLPLISLPLRDLFNDVALPHWLYDQLQSKGKRRLAIIAVEMAVFCGVVFLVVLVLSDFGKFMGVLGATVGNTLSFVLPGLFGIRCSVSRLETTLSVLMVIFGASSGAIGLFATFI